VKWGSRRPQEGVGQQPGRVHGESGAGDIRPAQLVEERDTPYLAKKMHKMFLSYKRPRGSGEKTPRRAFTGWRGNKQKGGEGFFMFRQEKKSLGKGLRRGVERISGFFFRFNRTFSGLSQCERGGDGGQVFKAGKKTNVLACRRRLGTNTSPK